MSNSYQDPFDAMIQRMTRSGTHEERKPAKDPEADKYVQDLISKFDDDLRPAERVRPTEAK
jgi:hypothetical protein